MIDLTAVKGMAGVKSLVMPSVVGGGLTTASMLAAADGLIDQSTGVAIGFVGGLIVATATGAWFIRGLLDGMKADVRQVKSDHDHEIAILKKDNDRMKKKLNLD